jgi:protein-tyrosine phosphatase
MRPQLFTIRCAGPGALSTMGRPRGGKWLADEMNGLAAYGVSVLVSLLSDAETAELGLSGEAEAAQASGLTFYRLPTEDRHAPDLEAGRALAGTLRELIADGAHVAVHCRFGIGRSSTLAAMVLVLDGTPPEQAWSLIAAARGRTVPDSTSQLETIQTLSAAIQNAVPRTHGPL